AFSVRWSGQVQPAFSETYSFSTSSDDGIRVWVNGVQLINDFTPGAVRDNSGSIALEANVKYDIVIEYFENNGNAVAALYWSSPSTPKAIIPTSRLYPAACGLQAAYFNGITPTGTPLLTRVDSTINFDLAYGRQPQILSPAPGVVPDDKFSVRWTAQVQALYTERYTFSTLSDDGIRLWINGVLLVDNWVNQGATEKSGTIDMVAGQKYDLMVEYYDNSGDAIAKLYWASASTPKAIVPQRCLFPPIAGLLDRSIPSTPDTSSPPPPPVITTPLPISVSPNPAQTGKPVKLALYTETNTTASISIYDLQGHAVRTVMIGLTKGNNSVTLDTYGLTAGLYIVRVNGIAQPFFGKLVLQ
ncbi:MAG TPA: PA14 domain-containing protein, partial [Chitinophagaceae bacterium]|nr:PA14 domain-containing protein [Chitinophagaceae bacterium]